MTALVVQCGALPAVFHEGRNGLVLHHLQRIDRKNMSRHDHPFWHPGVNAILFAIKRIAQAPSAGPVDGSNAVDEIVENRNRFDVVEGSAHKSSLRLCTSPKRLDADCEQRSTPQILGNQSLSSLIHSACNFSSQPKTATGLHKASMRVSVKPGQAAGRGTYTRSTYRQSLQAVISIPSKFASPVAGDIGPELGELPVMRRFLRAVPNHVFSLSVWSKAMREMASHQGEFHSYRRENSSRMEEELFRDRDFSRPEHVYEQSAIWANQIVLYYQNTRFNGHRGAAIAYADKKIGKRRTLIKKLYYGEQVKIVTDEFFRIFHLHKAVMKAEHLDAEHRLRVMNSMTGISL